MNARQPPKVISACPAPVFGNSRLDFCSSSDDQHNPWQAAVDFTQSKLFAHFAMKRLQSVALAFLLTVSGCAFAQPNKDANDARLAAERWMKLVDTEEYSAAWNTGSESMRKGMPKLAWNLLVSTVHLPLGTLKSRTFQSADANPATGDKPATITLTFTGDYENSHNVQEKVTTVKDADGQWRVSGFNLNSDAGKSAK